MGSVTEQRTSWTEYLPVDEGDYIVSSGWYISFERASVSFLIGQDLIRPNHITAFRILVCLFMLLFHHSLSYGQILVLTLLGAVSDYFDGALARAASRKTRLGTMLDPLADKFLAFVLIVILYLRHTIEPALLVVMALLEGHVLLIPLSNWDGLRKRRAPGGAGGDGSGRARTPFMFKTKDIIPGKIKVFLYFLAFLLLLLGKAVESLFLVNISKWILWGGIVMGGVALFRYVSSWIRGTGG